jgi:hypothetical protein
VKKSPDSTLVRLAQGVHRGADLLVGLVAAAGSVMSAWTAVIMFRSQAHPRFPEDSGPGQAAIAILMIPVTIWCAQIAWRLWSGHERPYGGGLLSPTVFVLSGLGVLAFLVSLVVSRGTAELRAAPVLLGLALSLFAMAAGRRRTQRQKERI